MQRQATEALDALLDAGGLAAAPLRRVTDPVNEAAPAVDRIGTSERQVYGREYRIGEQPGAVKYRSTTA
jgi:hypothetical protein